MTLIFGPQNVTGFKFKSSTKTGNSIRAIKSLLNRKNSAINFDMSVFFTKFS